MIDIAPGKPLYTSDLRLDSRAASITVKRCLRQLHYHIGLHVIGCQMYVYRSLESLKSNGCEWLAGTYIESDTHHPQVFRMEPELRRLKYWRYDIKQLKRLVSLCKVLPWNKEVRAMGFDYPGLEDALALSSVWCYTWKTLIKFS